MIRVQGTPSGSPADPSLASFPDHILLARVRVTAGATTVTNAMIDDLRPPWTVAAGGVLPVQSATARTALTAHQGFTIYRIDKGWTEVHDGTAWRVQGFVKTAALADITDPVTGQMCLLTTDNMIYRWNGSAWVGALPAGGTTAATRHRAKYFQSGSAQSIPNAAQQRLSFNNNSFTTDDWTTSTVSGGTKFTCARAGGYEVIANSRLASGAAGERGLTIANDAFTTVYGVSSVGTQGTLPWSACVAIEQDFSVGDDFCVWMYQAAGGAVSLDLAGGPTSVTIRYVGPKAT